MIQLIDAHTHLNTQPLLDDRQNYLQKFIDAGGVGLVISGASESYNIQGIEIAKIAERNFKYCVVKATLGWHPEECVENIITMENIAEKMQWIKDFYLTNSSYVVAI